MKNFVAFLILFSASALIPFNVAQATDALFTISGVNSKGEKIEIGLTRELATEIGLSKIHTKVLFQGEAKHSVIGVTIGTVLKKYDLVGNNLHITALDGYAIDAPRADYDTYPAMFALEIDGKPLSVRERGPSWIIYPVSDFVELDNPVFEARSVWQLASVVVNNQ